MCRHVDPASWNTADYWSSPAQTRDRSGELLLDSAGWSAAKPG
jgi:hypothetical protein